MEMTLRLPSSYVDIEREEMEYIEGGMSWYWKVAIGAGVLALGAGLIVAFAYGQLYLAARIMGWTFSRYVQTLGAAAVADVVSKSLVGTGATIGTVLTVFKFAGII